MQVGKDSRGLYLHFGDLDPLSWSSILAHGFLISMDDGSTMMVMYSLFSAFQRNLNHQKRSPDAKVMLETVRSGNLFFGKPFWYGVRRFRSCDTGDSGRSHLNWRFRSWTGDSGPGSSRTIRTRPKRDFGGKSRWETPNWRGKRLN